jgi:predicted nucleotidyltransferase
VYDEFMIAVADALPVMIERIARKFAPERIILFGSQARGDAGPNSDVDLLVIMTDESTDKRKTAVAIRVELADVLLPIDVLVATPSDLVRSQQLFDSVLRPAMEEGKVLYERESA